VSNLDSEINQHRQNGNGISGSQGCSHLDEYPRRKTTLGAGADVSLSLLSLLDVMSCSINGEPEIHHLARTEADRRELQALKDLWQSLGRPTSVFWRETRVFYNRILDSYDT